MGKNRVAKQKLLHLFLGVNCLFILPFAQASISAQIAPRPVYVASAADDLRSDPRGEFLSLRAASPVYGLFGKKSLFRRRLDFEL